jgi:hypothetical protein
MNKIKQFIITVLASAELHISLAILNYSIFTYRMMTDTITVWHAITILTAMGSTMIAVWLIEQKQKAVLKNITESVYNLVQYEANVRQQNIDDLYDTVTEVMKIQSRVIDALAKK